MLINFSNHPSKYWSDKQLKAAQDKYGIVTDLSFPDISPLATEDEVCKLSDLYLKNILEKLHLFPSENNAIHIMGEHTFTFSLINKLIKQNVTCVASTTVRKSIEIKGKKITEFNFVKFREYSRG